ncbi:hypothetical protein FB45DRAFT_877717 [Roridomyces roridus]|uniref:Uncharacterized protein n=1 Tax=Roridomyces roridus TaxID=1738132 RepID=A0AAD7B1Y4_9AGAR|nr:hypothetical protein FB45DRAFT_877717 [Roridomyces roridus]
MMMIVALLGFRIYGLASSVLCSDLPYIIGCKNWPWMELVNVLSSIGSKYCIHLPVPQSTVHHFQHFNLSVSVAGLELATKLYTAAFFIDCVPHDATGLRVNGGHQFKYSPFGDPTHTNAGYTDLSESISEQDRVFNVLIAKFRTSISPIHRPWLEQGEPISRKIELRLESQYLVFEATQRLRTSDDTVPLIATVLFNSPISASRFIYHSNTEKNSKKIGNANLKNSYTSIELRLVSLVTGICQAAIRSRLSLPPSPPYYVVPLSPTHYVSVPALASPVRVDIALDQRGSIWSCTPWVTIQKLQSQVQLWDNPNPNPESEERSASSRCEDAKKQGRGTVERGSSSSSNSSTYRCSKKPSVKLKPWKKSVGTCTYVPGSGSGSRPSSSSSYLIWNPIPRVGWLLPPAAAQAPPHPRPGAWPYACI